LYILELGTSLFREKRGFYAFLKPGDPGTLPMELFIDHRKLIYDGVRRYNSLNMVVNMVSDAGSLPDYTDSTEQILRYLDTDVEEQSIMEWINGKNTVGSICSYSSLTEFETLKVLAGLGYCGFIQFHNQSSIHVNEQDMEYQIEDLVRGYNLDFEFIYRWLMKKERMSSNPSTTGHLITSGKSTKKRFRIWTCAIMVFWTWTPF